MYHIHPAAIAITQLVRSYCKLSAFESTNFTMISNYLIFADLCKASYPVPLAIFLS
jgi:hypothetical protein